MLKKVSFLLVISALILLESCSPGSQKTSTSLVVLKGAATLSGASAGGIMIFGHDEQGNNFSLPYVDGNMELENGAWNFYAIAWDGGTIGSSFEGIMRCAASKNVTLDGGEVTVSLSLSSSGCLDTFFGPSDSKDATGEAKTFVPFACTDGDDLNRIDLSSCKNSVALSYRIEMGSMINGIDTGAGIISRCVDDATPPSPDINDGSSDVIKLPIFFPEPVEHMYRLTLYEGAGCAGAAQVIESSSFVTNSASASTYELSSQSTNNDLLVHNPVCDGGFATNTTPFVSGTGPADVHICNVNQFSSAAVTANDNIIIGRDIDFQGQVLNVPVIDLDYTGNIDGKGHTLSNWTYDVGTAANRGAFVRRLMNGGVIEDLNFENVTMNLAATGTLVGGNGIVVGQMSARTTIDNVELNNIIINAGNNRGKVGAITGVTTNVTPGEFAEVSNIKANNITINVLGAESENIGGLVGEGKELELHNVVLGNINILGQVNVTAADGIENIGGVVGSTVDVSSVVNVQVNNLNISNFVKDGGIPSFHLTNIGGVLGYGEKTNIFDVKVSGQILADAAFQVGGLAGELKPAGLQVIAENFVGNLNITSDTSQPPSARVGGVVGWASQVAGGSTFEFNNIRSLTNILCDDQCGLFAGASATSDMPFTVNYFIGEGTITSRDNAEEIGGFIGITNSVVTADNAHINVTLDKETPTGTQQNIGGFIGRVAGASGNLTVTNSFVSGSMSGFSGNTNTGGFFGELAKLAGTNFIGNTVHVFNQQGGTQRCVGTVTTGTMNPSNFNGLDVVDSPANCASATAAELTGAGVVGNLSLNTNFWENTASHPQLKFFSVYNTLGLSTAGTPIDPYRISTPAQWNIIGDNRFLMSSAFKLVNDIDFGSSSFTPIASATNPFSGFLMGNDKVIRNVNYTASDTNGGLGLIRNVSSAFISDYDQFTDEDKSLTLENITLDVGAQQLDSGILVGSFQDSVDGSSEVINVHIINSSITGGGTGSGQVVGGALGYVSLNQQYSELNNISVESTTVSGIAGTTAAGGVIGSFNSTYTGVDEENIERLTFSGSVTTPVDNAGGIFGYFDTIDKSVRTLIVNSGTTIDGEDNVGGIIGNHFKGVISQAVSKADVTATFSFAGGISGHFGQAGQTSEIDGSYAEGSVTASSGQAGCLSGGTPTASTTTISNSYANCSLVGGSTISYFAVNHVELTNPSVKNAYTGISNEGVDVNNAVFVAELDLQDESFLTSNSILTLGDPWIVVEGDFPRPWFEVFPQYLD